ncbi:MAG TPA: hypothetical protein VFO26_15510 [Gaiella sp.]|jgi:hypothetical protein|uniref:hypothetical protein n=1 Tax=Gaiella sp. TaxID=2663207 RepID=UPI002D802596|nr:hypothetical protein [Gaiella sp.]HET9288961.1 hypothetical protein [Gaiella sp.]
MLPRAEVAHWLFAAGFLFFGLVLLAEAIVGPAVFRRRAWRACLWPSLALLAGMWLWVITIFSTFSTLHLVAHSLWAQAATAAGAVQLAVVRGRLHSSYWSLVTSGALLVTGAAFLVHEQNGWLFARSAFLHHLIGWTLVVSALFPLGAAFRPRRSIWAWGFAATWVAVAVMLFADRDVAPIFGHLSDLAGGPP